MASIAAIPVSRRAKLATALRRAKRMVALATAVADLGGIWELDRVTARAFRFWRKRRCARRSRICCGRAHDAGELLLPYPDRPNWVGGFRCSAWASLARAN